MKMTTKAIDFNQELAGKLNTAIEPEGIQLPFRAPIMWWRHGRRQLGDFADVRFFGGWVCSSEDFIAATDEFGNPPNNFTEANYTGDDGVYAVYHARSVTIAPIIGRQRWIRNSSDDKGRSHMQMLVMLATVSEDGHNMKWGPVVLSMKGLVTKEFKGLLGKFDSTTLDARKEVAPGVPTTCFWRAIGTFGTKPKFSTVGSGNKSTSITYPTNYLPDVVTADHVVPLFVGNDIAVEMSELKEHAQDWANDKFWKTGRKQDEQEASTEVDPYTVAGYMRSEELGAS
jgi:hypothetical protein